MSKLLHEADTETYFLQIAEAEPSNRKGSSEGKSRFEVRNYSFAEILPQISKLGGIEILSDSVPPGRYDILMYTKDRSQLPYDTLMHALASTFKLKVIREVIQKPAIRLSAKSSTHKPADTPGYEIIIKNGLMTANYPRLGSLVNQLNAYHVGYFVTTQDTVTIEGILQCNLNDPASVINCLKEKNILIDTIEAERIRYTLSR